MKIENLHVSYAFSEYTIFDEGCEDIDGFHKEVALSSGDGTIGANLSEGYIELISVARGTGWHGPTYAKPLEKPFRLYQLAEFSIVNEFFHSVVPQGIITIELYDDSMRSVLEFRMVDGTSLTQSSFSVSYTNEDGSGFSTGSFITGSYLKTSKIKSDGSNIYKDFGSGYTSFGSVDNPSRIIKYLVVSGEGYEAEPLADFRIHDINIEVDLNAILPGGGGSESVECDGTETGLVEGTEWTIPPPNMDSTSEKPDDWWTGPWPRYHYRVDKTDTQGRRLMLEFSVDIIGDYRLDDSEITTGGNIMSPEDAAASELQFNSFYTDVIEPIIWVMKYVIAAASGIASVLSWTAAMEPTSFLLAYMGFISLVMIYNILLIATLIETFDDPFDRVVAFIDATIFTILPMAITTGCAVAYYALRAIGSTKLANHKPSVAGIIKAVFDGIYLVWWINVIRCLWTGQIPFQSG
ncbi:MAG: hypothetical protein P1Q69_07440 [Candidatus Thorarchaeota archaeon]|nr:hypothetical protein [Candidatus Thorarchaeota archaeon]